MIAQFYSLQAALLFCAPIRAALAHQWQSVRIRDVPVLDPDPPHADLRF